MASDLTLPALEPASVIDRTPLSCQLDHVYNMLYAVLEKRQEQTTSPVLKAPSFLLTLALLLLVSPALVTHPHDFCFILEFLHHMAVSEHGVPLKSVNIAEHFPSEKMPAVYTCVYNIFRQTRLS